MVHICADLSSFFSEGEEAWGGQKNDISVVFPVSNTHYLCKIETLIFETIL
jgi:hypothetical protein